MSEQRLKSLQQLSMSAFTAYMDVWTRYNNVRLENECCYKIVPCCNLQIKYHQRDTTITQIIITAYRKSKIISTE